MTHVRLPEPRLQFSSRRALVNLAAALLCSAGLSCGDDSGENQPSAGSSGGGGGGTSGSTAGTPAPAPPVECGPSKCVPTPSPLTGLLAGFGMGAAVPGLPMPVACCLDEASGKCGSAAATGATCEAPPTPDTRCPGINLGALGAAAGGATAALGNLMTGCCTPSGACGLDGSIFGRGCVETGEAKAMISAIPLVGTLLMFPAPKQCDAPLVVEGDAGTADAGL